MVFYYIRYALPDGRRRKEKAGTTLEQARRKLKLRLGEVASGTYVDPREAKEKAGPTFEEFADRFEKEYGNLARSDYYSQILKPLRAHFGKRLLRDITAADLDRYRVHCKVKDKVGDSTTRKRLTALGTLFKMAKRWGVLQMNPAADLEKPAEARHKTRYLTRDEWERLREAAEPWLKPILTMAIATGLRLKEVVGLTWENVDRENGLLYVSEDNKTGRPRAVPITPTVRAVLDGQVRHLKSPFVFLTEARESYLSKGERGRVSSRTRAAAKAAELAGVSFHTLRHTAGSWMAQAGYSAVQIAKVLGHATTATTDRYMHLSPRHLREPMQAIDAVLQGRSGPPEGPLDRSDHSVHSEAFASSASPTVR